MCRLPAEALAKAGCRAVQAASAALARRRRVKARASGPGGIGRGIVFFSSRAARRRRAAREEGRRRCPPRITYPGPKGPGLHRRRFHRRRPRPMNRPDHRHPSPAACPGLPAVTPSAAEGSRRCRCCPFRIPHRNRSRRSRHPSFSRLAPSPPNHYDVPMVMTAHSLR